MGPFDVLEVWQSVSGRALSASHRDEFLQRPEVVDLTRYGRRDLYEAGRDAMVVEAHGTILKLATWLEILRGTTHDRPAMAGGRLTSPEEILARPIYWGGSLRL